MKTKLKILIISFSLIAFMTGCEIVGPSVKVKAPKVKVDEHHHDHESKEEKKHRKKMEKEHRKHHKEMDREQRKEHEHGHEEYEDH